MREGCAFCRIVARLEPADIFWEDDLTPAFIDLRQSHLRHTLAVHRAHFDDVRALDLNTGSAARLTPSHPGVPHWAAYIAAGRETVRLDINSEVVGDPLRGEYGLAPQAVPNL